MYSLILLCFPPSFEELQLLVHNTTQNSPFGLPFWGGEVYQKTLAMAIAWIRELQAAIERAFDVEEGSWRSEEVGIGGVLSVTELWQQSVGTQS